MTNRVPGDDRGEGCEVRCRTRRSARPGLALLLAAACAGPVYGLSLRQAEERALAANPGLRATELEALAAGRRTAAARARRFGELELLADGSSFESPRLVRPISINLVRDPQAGFSQLPWDRRQTHFGAAYQLPLLAGGTLRQGPRIARLEQAAAEHTASFTRRELLTHVRAAYRRALMLRHAVDAARAYRSALERDESNARLEVELGALAAVEAAKLTYALRGAEAQVVALTVEERTAQATLAALLGEQAPAEGYELTELPEVPPPPKAEDDALRDALAGRLDLAASRDRTQAAERRRALARQAFEPRVALAAIWLRNDGPSIDGALDTHEVHLLLRLPLFDGGGRLQGLREAQLDLEAARNRQRAKELEISTQVTQALGRIEAARGQLDAGEAQRTLGREVARVERLKLDQGTGRVEDYLAARAQELAGETAYWAGLYAYQDAIDELCLVSAGEGVEP